jgi:hypothetical protein
LVISSLLIIICVYAPRLLWGEDAIDKEEWNRRRRGRAGENIDNNNMDLEGWHH